MGFLTTLIIDAPSSEDPILIWRNYAIALFTACTARRESCLSRIFRNYVTFRDVVMPYNRRGMAPQTIANMLLPYIATLPDAPTMQKRTTFGAPYFPL